MTRYERLVTGCYGASLLTLPWIGLGSLRILTGRDWGAGLQPAWVFMSLAVILTVGRNLSGQQRSFFFRENFLWQTVSWRLSFLVTVMFLLSGIGLWLAPPPVAMAAAWARFGKQIIQLAIMVVFTLWVIVWTRGRQRWVWTARMVVTGALLQAGYACAQFFAYQGHGPGFTGIDAIFTSNPSILSGSGELYLNNTMQHIPRLRGTACEPLYLGNFLLLAMPLVSLTYWRRSVRVAVLAVLGILLLMTWSRGAWLAGGVGMIGGGWVWWRLRGRLNAGIGDGTSAWPRTVVIAVSAALVLVVIWTGMLDLPARRLCQSFSTRDWSNLTRLYSLQAAWRAFLLSPVVGVGWGQFGWHFPVLVDPSGLQSQFTWPVVNNFFLKILCETGLGGFLASMLVLLDPLRRFWRRVWGGGPREEWARRGMIVVTIAFVGVWTQLLTFSQYNLPHIWVALGLILAASADLDFATWSPKEDS